MIDTTTVFYAHINVNKLSVLKDKLQAIDIFCTVWRDLDDGTEMVEVESNEDTHEIFVALGIFDKEESLDLLFEYSVQTIFFYLR